MHTEPMKKNRAVFTIDIQPDSDIEAEDIFESLQMLLAEEFHGDAEASFGSPDEIIDVDDDWMIRRLGRALTRVDELNPEEVRVLLKALFTDEDREAGLDNPTKYSINVSFTSSRRMNELEIGDLLSAVSAQVEEPMTNNEHGESVDAIYQTSEVVASCGPVRADECGHGIM